MRECWPKNFVANKPYRDMHRHESNCKYDITMLWCNVVQGILQHIHRHTQIYASPLERYLHVGKKSFESGKMKNYIN